NKRKSSFIAVSAGAQDDQFTDVCGTDKLSAARTGPSDWGIDVERPSHRKVIELVSGLSDLLPHAHAEIARGRSAARVHELRSIAMPRNVSRVDRGAVGRAGRAVTICHKLEFPQAHNGVAFPDR